MPIERHDTSNGRFYKTIKGKFYESVTSWLGRSSDNTWIDEWKDRVGHEEARKIVTRAANRGTQLHENVEKYLNNEILDVSKMPMLEASLFKPFAKLLSEHVNNIYALEYPLFSDTLRLAGTVDCVAEYDTETSLIDFKTSKAKKDKESIDNYFLQCSIYSYMIEEMYGIKIDQLVVLIAIDYENKVQVFKESRSNWKSLLVKRLKECPPKRGTSNG